MARGGRAAISRGQRRFAGGGSNPNTNVPGTPIDPSNPTTILRGFGRDKFGRAKFTKGIVPQ